MLPGSLARVWWMRFQMTFVQMNRPSQWLTASDSRAMDSESSDYLVL